MTDEIQEVAEETTDTQEVVTKGHMSKDDWVADGRDPNEWKSPEDWERDGKWIKELKKREAENNRQMIELNRYNKTQVDLLNIQLSQAQQELANLNARRDDAIDIADREAVKSLDRQIRNAENRQDIIKANLEPQQQLDKDVVAWEKANSWIFDSNDPRSVIAQSAYNRAIAEGLTPKQALREVDDEIKSKISVSKGGQQLAEPSRSSGKKEGVESVSWSSLTKLDLELWNTGAFENPKLTAAENKARFLKSVANSRKGI